MILIQKHNHQSEKGVLYSILIYLEDKTRLRIVRRHTYFTKIPTYITQHHHISIDSNLIILVSLWFDDNSTFHLSAAFHFAFVVWKAPLPKIKSLSLCMKFSIILAEIFPPDTSVRWLLLLEIFSLFYCIYRLLFCTKSLCFFLTSFSKCSSLLQRVLYRVKGRGKGCWVL